MEENRTEIHNEIPYSKKVKHYDTTKLPLRQLGIFTFLIWILSKILMIGQKYKVEKIDMDKVKSPYILLSNHMYFVDFYLNAIATFPNKVYNIATVDGYYRRPFLMEWIGCMCKRKFTTDPDLVKSVEHVLYKKKGILSMYPEARYSPVGTTAILPDSLGKLIKMNNVPVVVMIHHGNYLHTPFWNYRKKRKVPLHTTMTQILSAEDVRRMSASVIMAAVRRAMEYDDYRYQKDNGILITEPYRAEGLHKVLYQCPACLGEHDMTSCGSRLVCNHCGKQWELLENGSLKALQGETEFEHIPHWYEWQRQQVRQQLERGEYSFCDEVDVYSLPRCMKFEHLGKGRLRHTIDEGFVLEGEYRGEKYRVHRAPKEMYGVHIEYDY